MAVLPRLLLLLATATSCTRPSPAPSSAATTQPEARHTYASTVAMPDGCEWPLELEQLVCAVDSAIAEPSFDKARRACAERHMAPIRKELAAYSKSSRRLEEIRALRSRPLAMGPKPPGVALDPTRNPEEPLGSRRSNERDAERDQRAEVARQAEEAALRDVNARSERKLSELFRYVEPCLDARIPYETTLPPPPGTRPPSSGAEELL